MSEQPLMKLKGGEAGSVQLRLNLKGHYTWTIQLGVKEGETPLSVANKLSAINTQLEITFPNHAQKGTGRFSAS